MAKSSTAFCVVLSSVLILASCTTAQQEAALGCGAAGAIVGAFFGDKNAALYGAGIGAALCTVAATAVDASRKRALAKEQELDTQIAAQAQTNQTLAAENSALAAEIASYESQAANLETLRRQNEQEAARIAGEIQGYQAAAADRIAIIDQRITLIDQKLSDPSLSDSDRRSLMDMRSKLLERKALLGRAQAIRTA